MSNDLQDRRRRLDEARLAFETARVAPHGLAPDVSRSWRRCVSRLPVMRTAPLALDDPDARWSTSPIRRAAPDVVEDLARLATAEDWIAAVTDDAGHIIWTAAGRTMSRLAEEVNFVRGADWHEAAVGTNAPGLALHTGRPETVFATEHWCEGVQDWVCYAAPVHTPSGRVVGVLDLSAPWDQASPLALTTVTALARVIGQQLGDDAAASSPALRLSVLGETGASLDGRPLRLSLRQLEILVILSVRGAAGLDELHAHLYGDRPVTTSTLKAEISHLRQQLGGAIASRPYRLTVPVDADVTAVLEAVQRDDLDAATSRYRGQLLAMSESPLIVELRHHVDVALRAALLAGGTASELARYARIHPFDLEVLEHALGATSPIDPLHHDLVARLVRAGG